MKIKVLLMAAVCSMGAFGAYAQKGVDNGTQFGSGEDSIRCLTNVSLFVPYAKAGNFKDAYEFWKIVYDECPAATKDIYMQGVRIMAWKIAQEQDPTAKAALIEELMNVYDKRVKYFGNDRRYGKDWIVSRKAQDYIVQMKDKVDYNKVYNWLNEIVTEFGDKTDPLGISYFMYSSFYKMKADENHKSQYVDDYLKATKILDAQLLAAQAANNEKEVKNLTAYKTQINGAFANSGAADCETLQNMYASKVEEAKDDLAALKEIVSLLRRVRCQEIDAFFAASGYAYKLEPSADAAVGLAKQALRNKDNATALKYFEEAANMETDPSAKAELFYSIAVLESDQKNYSKAREYARKAIEINDAYGAPYILIGTMYATTVKSVFPNDGVLARAAYNAAIDQFEKARQVDQGDSNVEQANKLISTYRAHLPSTEEVFMHPDLEKGKSFTVGGWIGVTTRIR